ncbi:MAG: SGNH/GDSL hydrolase family protein [Solirubrobacteraceae bacterium]
MGDSVSYGYTEEKFDLNYPAEPPSAFEGGYPNLLAAKLAKKEAKAGNKLSLMNLACPGETSKGMIGDGPIAEGLEAAKETTHFTGGEAPCGWYNEDGFPRHVEFGGVSQLEAAVGIIESGAQVKDVTMQIGSNDELHKLAECASEAYLTAHGFTSFIECVEAEAKNTLFPQIITNLGLTVAVLREAGYGGPISILGFYNPQSFLVSSSDQLQKSLDEALDSTVAGGAFGAGVTVADPFKKTNPQGKKSQTALEKTDLEFAAICKYTEECNPFDRKLELEKLLKKSLTAEEAAAIEKSDNEKFEKGEPGGVFIQGDIHPTKAGDELFTKLLTGALKKA